MYWFNDQIVELFSLQCRHESLQNLARDLQPQFWNQLQHFSASGWVMQFGARIQDILEDREELFNKLSTQEKLRLKAQFWLEVSDRNHERYVKWELEMKPWIVRLQQLFLDVFQISGLHVNPVSTRIHESNGVSSSYVGDYRIRLGQSFQAYIPGYGCLFEHKGTHPMVFCLEDIKHNVFSQRVNENLNVDTLKSKPRKYQEFLKFSKLEEEVWMRWEKEMKQQGVSYWKLYYGI